VLAKTESDREFLADICSRSGDPLNVEIDAFVDSCTADELIRFRELLQQAAPSVRRAARSSSAAESYERHRDRSAKRERKQSLSSRDIGDIPPVVDPQLKAECEFDLKRYLENYHDEWFSLDWSDDHLRIIAKIEATVLLGLTQAIAMPRGSGKSTICVGAIIWSANYGHHLFQMLVHANSGKAENALDIIRFVYETNTALYQDFPEICYPVRALQRIANRAKGQMYHGEPTYLQWSGDRIILPVIPGAKSSGCVIMSAGLQEAVRGAVMVHPATGLLIRPSLALVDDPQTRESAMSELQSQQRLDIITADLMGCAGPGMQLAVLLVCTVIAPGDLADMILDPERFPEWSPERCRLISEMPENLDIWHDEYDQIRRRCAKRIKDEGIRNLAEGYQELTDFYLQNRKKLDQNGKASWEARKLPHDVSALQHGMNIYLSNPGAFWSEYQNDPIKAIESDGVLLEPEDISRKVSGFARLQIPTDCQYLTSGIDVQKRILYYTVVAWSPSFTGYIINRGTFPQQPPGYFSGRKPRNTLQHMFPDQTPEGAVLEGLMILLRMLFTEPYRRVDGLKMNLDLCLPDRGWLPNIVDRAAETSEFSGNILPCNGRKIGPDETPLSQCRPREGEFIGDEWTLPAPKGEEIRRCQLDSYHWKDFTLQRLATPIGQRGCLSLYGQQQGQRFTEDHDFYAEHLTSEYYMPQSGRRLVNMWKPKPGRSENHWWDTLVYAAVAASVKGASAIGFPLIQIGKAKGRNSRKVTYLDQQSA